MSADPATGSSARRAARATRRRQAAYGGRTTLGLIRRDRHGELLDIVTAASTGATVRTSPAPGVADSRCRCPRIEWMCRSTRSKKPVGSGFASRAQAAGLSPAGRYRRSLPLPGGGQAAGSASPAGVRCGCVTARATDWGLALLVGLLFATGVMTLFAGGQGDAWVFAAHGVGGFALAGMLAWKLRRVWRRLAQPARWDRRTAAGAGALGLARRRCSPGWAGRAGSSCPRAASTTTTGWSGAISAAHPRAFSTRSPAPCGSTRQSAPTSSI
jgi:hypothetical protein